MKKKKSPEKKQKFTWKSLLEIIALPVWVTVVFVGVQYASVFLGYFTLGLERLQEPVWTTVLNAFIYALSVAIIVFVPVKLFKRWKTSREELGLKGLPTWTDLLLAPVALVIYLVRASSLVGVIAELFPGFDLEEAQDVGYNFLNSGLDRLVAFVALVILAPVAEELMFRGWLYGKLRAKIPGKASLAISVLIVSVLFGILHGQWNVGINVFVMSLALCGLREITGTIYSGIFLHMLKNCVAFMLLYVFNFGF